MSKVAVIGYGYVGSSIAKPIAEAGHDLIIIDTIKVDSPYPSYTNYSYLKDIDIALVCVPTPLTEDGLPNTKIVTQAVVEASRNMPDDSVIVIESTVPIGFTRQISQVVSQQVAFSAERIDPGSLAWEVADIPKVVSANSEETLEVAHKFYSSFIKVTFGCLNTDEAEAAKLLENAYRLINISFINEYAMLMDRLDLDVHNVINLAATKPYGFQKFKPGIGAGGHCIPVDPMFLLRHGVKMPMLTTAKEINDDININYYIDTLAYQLKDLRNKRILVVGIAYKPNVNDVRESVSLKLIDKLRMLGAQVSWHDNVVLEYNGEYSTNNFSDFDAVVIAQRHYGFADMFVADIGVIVDCERRVA